MFENEKFKEGGFDKEKSVIISESDMAYANPSERLIREIPKCICGKSDYGFSDPIGCREIIKTITKEKDVEWYILEAFRHLISFGHSYPVFQIIREKYGLGYIRSSEAFLAFP